MPSYFVSAQTRASAPSDANDGFDTFGLQPLVTSWTYDHTTRTLTDLTFAGLLGTYGLVAGAWLAVVSGTNWTAGLYQVESVNDGTGSITFAAASGINVTNSSVPTLSTGPKLTLAGAISACTPGTAANPYTSYAANSACRVVLCAAANGSATHNLATAMTISLNGSAANRNSITVGDHIGNVGREYVSGTITVEPSSAFTTGTALITTSGAYLDIDGIRFNGTANGDTATFALSLGTSLGYNTVKHCVFTGCTNSGVNAASRFVCLYNCTAHGNTFEGFVMSSVALNDIRLFGCEAYSNGRDGFRVSGSGDGVLISNCVSHHNSGTGFDCVSTTRSVCMIQCVASHNALHGFSLAGGSVGHVIGCVSVANGTTSSHRQYDFTGTSWGTNGQTFEGNYAGASGSAVNTNATNLTTAQLTTGSAEVLVNTTAGTYDGRLTTGAKNTLAALVSIVRGAFNRYTVPPGLSQSASGGGGGVGFVGGGRSRFLGFGGNGAS